MPAHALVRALIHSRLDYCNGVLAGLPLYMFKATPIGSETPLLGSCSCYPVVKVYRSQCETSYTGSGFHSASCTNCVSFPTNACTDWHPNIYPDGAYVSSTFQAVRTSGQRRPVSLWCRLRTEKHLVTKAFSTQVPLPGTIFPVSCGTMLQRFP